MQGLYIIIFLVCIGFTIWALRTNFHTRSGYLRHGDYDAANKVAKWVIIGALLLGFELWLLIVQALMMLQ